MISVQSDVKRQDCEVCFNVFDDNDRRPRSLPCGHTICSKCVSDNLKENKLVCPSCRREHEAVTYTNFPVNYKLESMIQEMSSTQPSPSKTSGLPSDESRGISKKLKSMRQELINGMESISMNRQRASSQLHQYESQMKDCKEQHQQLMGEFSAIVRQHEDMIKHIEKESSRVEDCIKEEEEERQRVKVAEDILAAASTAHDIFPALEEADHCYNNLDSWTHRVQAHFPDTELTTQSLKLRERTRSALQTLSVPEKEKKQREGISLQSGLLFLSLLVFPLLLLLCQNLATSLECQQNLATSLEYQQKLATSLSECQQNLTTSLEYQQNLATSLSECQQKIDKLFTVENLKIKTSLERQLVESGRVYAVQDSEEGGRRWAKITLCKNQLCLHVLNNHKPSLPDNGIFFQHSDVMKLVDPSSRRIFLELGDGESTLGRLYIQLMGDTKGAKHFSILCTGEMGPSYANTKTLKVWNKGHKTDESVWFGDYERNDGSGGKALVPGLKDEIGGKNKHDYVAGLLGGMWLKGNEMAAQFHILTRGKAGWHHTSSIGIVDADGLSVLTEIISRYDNIRDVSIQDCGIVLPS